MIRIDQRADPIRSTCNCCLNPAEMNIRLGSGGNLNTTVIKLCTLCAYELYENLDYEVGDKSDILTINDGSPSFVDDDDFPREEDIDWAGSEDNDEAEAEAEEQVEGPAVAAPSKDQKITFKCKVMEKKP